MAKSWMSPTTRPSPLGTTSTVRGLRHIRPPSLRLLVYGGWHVEVLCAASLETLFHSVIQLAVVHRLRNQIGDACVVPRVVGVAIVVVGVANRIFDSMPISR